jgi:hypothetical protein
MELEMMIKTLNSKVHEPTDSPYGNTLVAQHWRFVVIFFSVFFTKIIGN